MNYSDDRRRFLQILAMGATATTLPQFLFAQEKEVKKKTFTYKSIERCEIKADAYGISGNMVRPVGQQSQGGDDRDCAMYQNDNCPSRFCLHVP